MRVDSARLELARSRWPLRLLWLALLLAFISILASGLPLLAKPGLLLVALAVARWEWRRQAVPVALQVDQQGLQYWLADGQMGEQPWPLTGMANRYWLSFVVDQRRWRRRYLTLFVDQLDADSYRHLRARFRH